MKGRGRRPAAVREKKAEEAERVQGHENGEGNTIDSRVTVTLLSMVILSRSLYMSHL